MDIGGETFFLQRMIRKYHDAAEANGVKLIPVAGYESLPFDLLTLLAVNEIQNVFHETCAAVKIITSFARSAPIVDNRISGGSLGTMKNILAGDNVNAYNDAACLLPDIAPRTAIRRKNKVVYKARIDPDLDVITAPLFPAPFLNVPVILRSAHLLREDGSAYAEDFCSADAMTLDFFAATPDDKLKQARQIAARYRITDRAMAGPSLLRRLIKRRLDRVGIKPRDGPSDEALACVDYKLELFATSNTGRRLRGILTAEGHPGYLSTARIAVEAGMALSLERGTLTPHAGILTPASGLGLGIIPRLEKAGIRMWIDSEGASLAEGT